MTDTKTRVVDFARGLGFDSCRVVACSPPLHAEEFRDWLGQGSAGEMGYMQRGEDKRCDPQLVLPGARSVIVLAMNYFNPVAAGVSPAGIDRTAGQAATREDKRGRIAQYARGQDYHDVIQPRLEQLDMFLREAGGTQKCYVDTGPVLERDHAAAAGIGWHGKSTMLISEKLGTWFFLAEILTTLELSPDPPARDRCGTCHRCLDACPTNAITAPHKLDARRCISYLTIELKTSIPLELRPLIGDRIFGCDDCLTACPWNRFAKASNEAAFAARKSTTAFSLRDYLKLSDPEFRNLFRNSPIKRIKRRGFLRNVCVALGNNGDESDLFALEAAASDPEPLIAEHARWAIDQITARRDGASTLLNPNPRPTHPISTDERDLLSNSPNCD